MIEQWITSGFLAVSNDFGATFTASQHVRGEPPSECSIAFASDSANSTLIMNCRSGQNHRRAQLYWRPLSNGTYASTEPTYPPQFTDPGCQGSIINVNNGTLLGETCNVHCAEPQYWCLGVSNFVGCPLEEVILH